MADCVCLSKCDFFNDLMPKPSQMGDFFKSRYCKGDNTCCARYRIYQWAGREAIPNNLYPNMIGRAETIIDALVAV